MLIDAQTELTLMHDQGGFENLVLNGTSEGALQRFAKSFDWPKHLLHKYPDPALQAADSLKEFFAWSKGAGSIADFLAQCSESEIPQWLRDACVALRSACASGTSPVGATPANTSFESVSGDGAH